MKLYRYRRYSQTAFLLLFFGLLTATVWPLGRAYLGAFLMADPLIAANSLAGGVWKWEMVLAVAVLASALVLGRAFCGYVCPMGFLVELTGPHGRKLPKTRARDALLKAPVFILIGSLALLVFGGGFYLIFDPLSLLTRSSATLVYPLLDRLARLAGDLGYRVPAFQPAVDTATNFLSGRIIFQQPLFYRLQLGILAMFLLVAGLSYWQRRAWCRHLCPLGALLGFAGRWSVFGRVVDQQKCIRCLKCENVCPMDAVRDDGRATDKSRCELSFECADVCPEGAIRFGLKPRSEVYSPSRRTFLTFTGLAALTGVFVSTSLARAERNVHLIRPPGARAESDFLALCSRCGQCLKVCPTNVLQPSLVSAGWEGVFTPQMNFRHAYCNWSCNECGKVCPTGAIGFLGLAAKRRRTIGRAYIDHNRCFPWADFKNCLVCQELCPIPNKAIVFQEETVPDPRGRPVALKRPVVIAERCIGCGICEFKCPVPYQAAIQVRATTRTSRGGAP